MTCVRVTSATHRDSHNTHESNTLSFMTACQSAPSGQALKDTQELCEHTEANKYAYWCCMQRRASIMKKGYLQLTTTTDSLSTQT